jgi:ankyrin repeat protein
MMRHISDQLQESDDALLVEHFFNARGSGLEKTFLGLLQSLIYQLLSEVPEFYNAFVLIYRRKDMFPGQWNWRQSELKNFLQSQLKRTKLKLIILVDALDECSLNEIASVVTFLESLSLDAVDAGTNLRICLSSRPYPNVSMAKNLEFTLDGNAEHNEDIEKYVRVKLKTKNPGITTGILQKANGVFLWVVLVVEILNGAVDDGRPEEMQKTLVDIPSDLDNFFERVIFDNSEKNPETLLMFQLVLFSERTLSPEELVFAVIAKRQEGYLKPRSQYEMTNDLLRARIVNSSKGLIEVSAEKMRTQFIHQTVTDFFLRNRRLERLYPTLEPDAIAASHDRIRACCLDYIEKCPINSQPHNGHSTDKLQTEYPFLEYSAMYLLDHAEAALQGHQLGIENDRWPLSSDPWFQTWNRITFAIGLNWYIQGDLNVGLVYILVLHKYHKLLATILKRSDVDVNTQGGLFNNALQLAVAKRDDVATRMLLERGASVQLNGGYFGTVLQVASAQGNRGLVSTIIEKGADLNVSGGLYGTALQAAAARGNFQIMKSLLERGANVNVYGGIFGSALQGAAHNGNLEGVNLLLKQGALVISESGSYGSALHAAINIQKIEIFQNLLHAGADVNSCGRIYGYWSNLDKTLDDLQDIYNSVHSLSPTLTGQNNSLETSPALLWAARNLGYDQVKLLLEKGADVNAASGPWESQESLVSHIYQRNGASLNYELGMTALIWAARNGKRDMIELLLEYGANPDAHSSSGETALLASSEAGHEGIVSFLIKRGANLFAKDSFGENALYKAAANGHVDVMRLLLNHKGFHESHNWSNPHMISRKVIDTIIVNGGFSSVWSDDRENDVIRSVDMNHSIKCLVMNGGFLCIGLKRQRSNVDIEKIQINGGICYIDLTHPQTSFYIRKLEINGGSLRLGVTGMAGTPRDIKTLELNNGCLSIFADDIAFQEVFLSGGSFKCNSRTDLQVHQLTLGSALSGSTRKQILANPPSTSCLSEIYVKHSDGQIEQHGTTQSGDQNIQMSTVLSPLYVAAKNGHLEAVQLLLQSGAKFTNAWTPINPLYIAQRHGHHEIVRFLQEKAQAEERIRTEENNSGRGQKQKRKRDET